MRRVALALALSAAAAGARAGAWDIPAEGSCVADPAPRAASEADAVRRPLHPGDVIGKDDAARLREFVPEELWSNAERFFYDGMQLEIGPCFRDYSPPAFFAEATQRFRGQPSLAADGALQSHKAGLPFAPDTLAADDPQLAAKWAWNAAKRYQAAGRYAEYRISLLSRELTQRFEGSAFYVPLAARADRAADGYRYPAPFEVEWVAGGTSRNLDTGKEASFRQYATGGRQPDIFVWAAEARRVIRATSPDSEDPITAFLADASIGDGLFLHGGEPQLHDWTLVGVRDLLAPINIRTPTYPADSERAFGPYGVSLANDRWELRRAIVLEGRLKQGTFADGVQRYRWYLDLQTLAPLYYAAYRSSDSPGGIGFFAHRWSEDRSDYPRWRDDPARPVRVLDRVALGLVDWNNQETVRVEAWGTVSIPPDEKRLKRMMSQSSLRGH